MTTLAALALLAGCSSVRQAREAQDPTQIPPGERTVTAAEAGLSAGTLLDENQAIQVALSFHPSVTQARQELCAATQQVRRALAAYGPTLQADGQYRRATSRTEADGDSATHDSYSAGVSANLSLLDFGRTPAAVRQARARQEAAEARLHASRNDVRYEVQVAFSELLQSLDLLRVTEETVRQFETHLVQAEAMAAVGRRIRYDVTKAQVDLGNARLGLLNASNGVKRARATLVRNLGLASAPDFQIAPSPEDTRSLTWDEALRAARENSPSLRALRAEIRAASASVDAAVAELYPSLDFNAGYTWSGDSLPLLGNWSISLGAVETLWDHGRRSSAILGAITDLRIARARAAGLEQQLGMELTQSFAQLDSARQKLELTGLIVQQAQENLLLISERYRVGSASAVEKTDAEVSLVTAQADRIRAQFDQRVAVATIRHTMGEPIQ